MENKNIAKFRPIDFLSILCFNFVQMKKNIFFILLFFISIAIYSQNIMTAGAFFSSVSERYAQINDYVVGINIKINDTNQTGTAMFKRPDMLRIDFVSPAEQCIIFAENVLSISLPQYRTILTQNIEQSFAGGSSLATPQGLSLMKRAYTIQYEHSAEPVPLDENSGEKVIVLIMNRKSASETFKRLKVMVSPESKLIRRIEALPIDGGPIVFNFYNYRINIGVSSKDFVFDAPPTAKVLNNFLFVE